MSTHGHVHGPSHVNSLNLSIPLVLHPGLLPAQPHHNQTSQPSSPRHVSEILGAYSWHLFALCCGDSQSRQQATNRDAKSASADEECLLNKTMTALRMGSLCFVISWWLLPLCAGGQHASRGQKWPLFVIYSLLVTAQVFTSVHAGYFKVGHTHNKVDQVFSQYATKIKNTRIEEPNDVKDLINQLPKKIRSFVTFQDTAHDWWDWVRELDVQLSGLVPTTKDLSFLDVAATLSTDF